MPGWISLAKATTSILLNATPDLVAAGSARRATTASISCCLIWSPQALRDVQRLHRFLAARNLDASRRAVRAIRHGVQVLERQPMIGRPVQDMDPEYREWLIDFGDSGYVALYRVGQEEVIILAVRHQREVGY